MNAGVKDAPTRSCSRRLTGHPASLMAGEAAAAGLRCPPPTGTPPWVASWTMPTRSRYHPTADSVSAVPVREPSSELTHWQTRAPISTAMSAASTRSLPTTQFVLSVSNTSAPRELSVGHSTCERYRHEMPRTELRPGPRSISRSDLRPLVQGDPPICPPRSLCRPYVKPETRVPPRRLTDARQMCHATVFCKARRAEGQFLPSP